MGVVTLSNPLGGPDYNDHFLAMMTRGFYKNYMQIVY